MIEIHYTEDFKRTAERIVNDGHICKSCKFCEEVHRNAGAEDPSEYCPASSTLGRDMGFKAVESDKCAIVVVQEAGQTIPQFDEGVQVPSRCISKGDSCHTCIFGYRGNCVLPSHSESDQRMYGGGVSLIIRSRQKKVKFV